jgi:hypothetical protein
MTGCWTVRDEGSLFAVNEWENRVLCQVDVAIKTELNANAGSSGKHNVVRTFRCYKGLGGVHAGWTQESGMLAECMCSVWNRK